MNPTKNAPVASGGRWKPVDSHYTPAPKTWRPDEPATYLRSDPLYDASVAMAARRVGAELAVVGVLCADPARTADAMRSTGFTPELVDPEDLRLIALAADGARDRYKAARLARMLLRYFGHWDETDTRAFICGSVWSDHSLVALFTSQLCTPHVASCLAARLVDIDRRQRGAMEHYRQALELLTGEVANG